MGVRLISLLVSVAITAAACGDGGDGNGDLFGISAGSESSADTMPKAEWIAAVNALSCTFETQATGGSIAEVIELGRSFLRTGRALPLPEGMADEAQEFWDLLEQSYDAFDSPELDPLDEERGDALASQLGLDNEGSSCQ